MATAVVGFGLADPYIPSLLEITVFKIAETLLNDLDFETLDSILTEMKLGNSARFNESILESCKAKERLLLIPVHLRRDVLTAVMSMHDAISYWRRIDFDSFQDIDCVFYWRWDGLIDKIKTAQHLALNANINIKDRFVIACEFCLEKNVLSLWSEMEASDKEGFLRKDRLVTHFWANWINGGSRIPWLQAFRDYYQIGRNSCLPYHHSFFPLLKPEERKCFLISFDRVSWDDLRLCLYVLTEEEKMFVFDQCLLKLLVLHLYWPLQSFFLQKVEKVLHLLDELSFTQSLHLIWLNHTFYQKKDFDYHYLFVNYWNMSTQRLREYGEKDEWVKKDLDACFNKKTEKRRRIQAKHVRSG